MESDEARRTTGDTISDRMTKNVLKSEEDFTNTASTSGFPYFHLFRNSSSSSIPPDSGNSSSTGWHRRSSFVLLFSALCLFFVCFSGLVSVVLFYRLSALQETVDRFNRQACQLDEHRIKELFIKFTDEINAETIAVSETCIYSKSMKQFQLI